MASEHSFGGAIHLYPFPGGEFRYGIEDNADFPDCVDFFYEEWEDKKWVRKHTFEGIDAKAFMALSASAETLMKMTNEELPSQFEMTVQVVKKETS